MTNTVTVKTPTLAAFKRFSKDIAPAARAVLMARIHAEMERERVNAYVLPIFAGYKFTNKRTNDVIASPDDLFMVDDLDDPLVLAFYADCDDAHRAHGFTGPKGHCPALVAENLVMAVERELLKLGSDMFGVKFEDTYGDDRKKALELLIGSALKAENDRSIR